ncbi:MAG: glucuronate isomerase [Bacteroidetes bacterium]|nr:glucuronate isomerase [Bacteroidota bacterium]
MNSSNYFLSEDFLLFSSTAKKLYHDYASKMPIIDYHNHLPPNEIAANKKFSSLTEIWLKGDHYKWRAMRTLGVNEKFITGDASEAEKFNAWASAVPKTIRNPLFHWTHMEMKDPFGVQQYLNEQSASTIYKHCNELLQTDEFSTQSLLQHFNVEMVGTTDDPCDDLQYHKAIQQSNFKTKVLPSFRPDKVLDITNRATFLNYLQQLEKASGLSITSIDTLLEALQKRVDYFHLVGGRIADYGLATLPSTVQFSETLEKEFVSFLSDINAPAFSHPENFAGYILLNLCRMYHKKGWVQQFHIGAIRNNNNRLLKHLGPDTGFDSINDIQHAKNLSTFLDALDQLNELGKTIIYNNNPADNEVFASMIGNFNDGTIKGKVQFGSGWWYLDQIDGMEKQLNALSNIGIVSTFVGMLTDSRSFLSYPRHEYFRRVLCNLFGNEMENGKLPSDELWVGNIIKDICYNNAKEYFNL